MNEPIGHSIIKCSVDRLFNAMVKLGVIQTGLNSVTEDDKLEQNINRSVAIDYDPNGETGGLLNAYSDGEFGKRTLTPDEQRINDAWSKKTAKKTKQIAVSKPDPNKKTIEGF